MIKTSDKISSVFIKGFRSGGVNAKEHMFIEDFSRVAPFRDRDDIIKCILSPEDEDFSAIVMEMLPTKHGYSSFHNLSDSILDCINNIAGYLVNYGLIVLEFVTETDMNDEVSYKLVTVRGDEIRIGNENIIQVIEPNEVMHLESTMQNEIPKSKVFVIQFPESLGGMEFFLEHSRVIGEMGDEFFNFGPLRRNPVAQPKGYDFNTHIKAYETSFWKYTTKYHWHHRHLPKDKFSSYYDVYRHLMFRKNQIILRDHIINELQFIVKNVANRLGKEATLSISGLTTLHEVNSAIRGWETGSANAVSIGKVLRQ